METTPSGVSPGGWPTLLVESVLQPICYNLSAALENNSISPSRLTERL